MHPELLWPQPKTLESQGAAFPFGPGVKLQLEVPESVARRVQRRLELELESIGTTLQQPVWANVETTTIRLRLEEGGRAGGYRLRVGARRIEVTGDPPGLFAGVITLGQWLRLHPSSPSASEPRRLHPISVEDWPDFTHRGVLLDISRNKVPTNETLEELVDRLAGWKINQLQLYTEHTFSYAGHEVVWHGSSPITPEEARRLDALCRERFIELVPNQNSFGHLHRWLRHLPYRELAECPEGVEHPFSPWSLEPEPFSLCPTDPGSLELLRDLYDQLLPNFRSSQCNVGLDETFDLGRGRSAAACKREGKGRVYLDFLRGVHRLLAARDRRMQFWGDVVLEHPELIPELPPDAVALEWGYEADHPFAEHGDRFAKSGLEFYVCPGTSSWSSFAGRTENALLNLAEAARSGHHKGASGYLVADWGDFGHLQPLPVSYLGILAGAGFAWNVAAAGAPLELPIGDLLDHHAFTDQPAGLGQIAADLGNTYRLCGGRGKNGSPLFFLLLFPQQSLTAPRYRGLNATALRSALTHVEDQLSAVERVERACVRRGWLPPAELAWAARLLHLGCRVGLARLAAGEHGELEGVPREARQAVSTELATLAEELKELWLARNRPGGLSDSLNYFEQSRRLFAG